MKLKLVKPSKKYQTQIVDMLEEWSKYNIEHPEANGSPKALFLTDYHNFKEYLKAANDAIYNPKEGLVPATLLFAYDKDRDIMVGACQIRHYLNEKLREGGGHIGDGVRPSERRKGYGTEIIRLALEECKFLKIKKVLISANSDNIGSLKAIKANGGIYEKTVMDDGKPTELYWIHLDGHTKYTQHDLALDIETLRKKRFMNLISEEKFEEEKHELAQKYLADKED